MALTTCKECKKQISKQAKTCPSCGAPNRQTSTFAKLVTGLAVIGVIMAMVIPDTPTAKPTTVTAPKVDPAVEQQRLAAAKRKQAEEDAQCRKDLSCWGNKHIAAAGIYCDAPVEKLAKYQHEWTDSWAETKFSHFRWQNEAKGVMTFIGDKIKFQNGFGAWQNSIYECDMNTLTDEILDVRARPGRLG